MPLVARFCAKTENGNEHALRSRWQFSADNPCLIHPLLRARTLEMRCAKSVRKWDDQKIFYRSESSFLVCFFGRGSMTSRTSATPGARGLTLCSSHNHLPGTPFSFCRMRVTLSSMPRLQISHFIYYEE